MTGRERTKWIIGASFGVFVATSSASCAQQAESETRFVAVGDAQIEYVVGGPDNGETVFLIHGALLGRAFALVQESLQERGYRTIRIHRRGFEGSSVDAPPQSNSRHAMDAIAVLDDLGIDEAHVAGHSAGARIALTLLVENPHRVQSLMLIDPVVLQGLFASQPDVVRSEMIGPALAALDEGDAETGLELFARGVFGDDWRGYFDVFPGGYQQALADANRFVRGAPAAFDSEEIMAIGVPIRVLWAGENEGSAAASELADSLPTAETGYIEETDHALITQRPAAVTKDLSAFVGRSSD